MSEWLSRQGLTEADLEANRQGRLTDVQRDRLRDEARTRTRAGLVLMVFGAIGASASVAITASDKKTLLVSIPVMTAACLLAGWLLGRWMGRKILAEVEAPALTAVDGNIEQVSLAPNRRVVMLKAAGRRYFAPGLQQLVPLLERGRAVRLHVLPRNSLIVSIEPR